MIKSRNELIALLKEDAYRKGDFTLSSGKKSEHYVNCKPVTLQGDALMFISWCIFECLDDDCDAVGGLTLGDDPLVAGVAIVSAIEERFMDGLIVRKEPKGHGTQAWIEGPTLPLGSKVTVLEDVITTGGSAIKAAKKLRDAGYVVENVVAIIDRQEVCSKCNTGEADSAMKDANLKLTSLFKLEEII
tara:strand:+ start:135 stop:698 length:564 start_codon:yes stop_codon:yes gene_type:complete